MRGCLRTDPHKFYLWRKWKVLRRQVLEMDHFECACCAGRYRPDLLGSAGPHYTRATMVHHDRALRTYPQYALDVYYTDHTGIKRRNLWPLCHDCHEAVHGYRQASRQKVQPFKTDERWD